MTPVVLGQILGISFACGLNLYLTVAALGLLSRFGIIADLPPGLQGLESFIVIGSAAALYLAEAIIDKVGHADSIWDTVHTFIRPPAAALLALGALWGAEIPMLAAGAAIAFLVALVVHGTKAGVRLALNASMRAGHIWVSIAEDVVAVAFVITAFLDPWLALIGAGVGLALSLLLGPRYWRAFRLGVRALGAWLRTLFSPGRWREEDELPRRVRRILGPTPLGSAPPRGARGALHGPTGVGAYRNGWLVVTDTGPIFVHRTLFGHRTVELPRPATLEMDPGVWANMITLEDEEGAAYRLYMLKDGPSPDLAIPHLRQDTA